MRATRLEPVLAMSDITARCRAARLASTACLLECSHADVRTHQAERCIVSSLRSSKGRFS